MSLAWIVRDGKLDLRFQVETHCGHTACVNPEHAHLVKAKQMPKNNGVCWLEKKGDGSGGGTKKQRLAFKIRLKKAALISAKKSGRDAFTWKDLYTAYLRTPEWKAKRAARLAETGGLCAFCGVEAHAIHHVVYPKKLGSEAPEDLVPVCKRHHTVLHGKVSAWVCPESDLCAFCGKEATKVHKIKYRRKIGGAAACKLILACVTCAKIADGDVSVSSCYQESNPECATPAVLGKESARAKREKRKEERLLAASRKRIAIEVAKKEIQAESRRLG